MAIKNFNDNIKIEANKPIDFKFGPFDGFTQAHTLIPISQRYHGLVFGIYTSPLDIENSDINFYYYYDGLTNDDVKPLTGNFVTLDTIQTITGEKTFDARVRVTNNEISITNWVSTSGAYDKLSIDFGENRGFGYDGFLNQFFIAGTFTVPFKVDTDAPTDSLEILPTGGLKVANIPTGTPVSSLGLDVNNEVVKGSVTSNFVTLDTTQTITGEKTINATTIIGDPSIDYLIWDNVDKTFAIFLQAQFLHKYRGGASGALNIGQYDISGNASINNTSNGLLSLGTNNISRVEIEADGDVLLKKVDSGTGEILMIEPSGRVVKGTGGVIETFNTFTPTLTDSGGGATYAISGATGQIYTIGDLVTIYVAMNVDSTTGTPTGNLHIGGITGGHALSGIVSGQARRFSGSNLTDTQLGLMYVNNIDSPLTTITVRNMSTGAYFVGISFTSGGIELQYQFRKS